MALVGARLHPDTGNTGWLVEDDAEDAAHCWVFPPEISLCCAVSLGGLIVLKDKHVGEHGCWWVVWKVHGIGLELVILQSVDTTLEGGVEAHVLEEGGLEADHILLGKQEAEVVQQPITGHLLVEEEEEASQARKVSGAVELTDVAQLGELKGGPVGAFLGGHGFADGSEEGLGRQHVILNHQVVGGEVGSKGDEVGVIHVLLGPELHPRLWVVVVSLEAFQGRVKLMGSVDKHEPAQEDVVREPLADVSGHIGVPSGVCIGQVHHHHHLLQLLF